MVYDDFIFADVPALAAIVAPRRPRSCIAAAVAAPPVNGSSFT